MTQLEITADRKNLQRRKNRLRMMRATQAPSSLSLTSLMDIVTNILVYIIKIFVVSPITIQDPSVTLPRSYSQEEIQDAMVVMITGMQRRESSNNVAEEVLEIPTIIVDDKVVVELDAKTYRVPKKMKEREFVIAPLKQELIRIRKSQGKTAELTDNGGFTGNIVIVADKHTPYKVIADVLVTCGEAGFGEFKFAIVKSGA